MNTKILFLFVAFLIFCQVWSLPMKSNLQVDLIDEEEEEEDFPTLFNLFPDCSLDENKILPQCMNQQDIAYDSAEEYIDDDDDNIEEMEEDFLEYEYKYAY